MIVSPRVRDTIRDEIAPARLDAHLNAVAAFPTPRARCPDDVPDWAALPIEAILALGRAA